MATNCCYMCSHFSVVLVAVFVVLKVSGIFITTNSHHGQVAGCYMDDKVSFWHSWWSFYNPTGTKCFIQCPLHCICSLGNFREVVLNCTNGNISVTQVTYPVNVTFLSWAHSEIHSIEKDSFLDLLDTLRYLHLHNNSLQHLQPGVFQKLVNLVALDLRHNMLEDISSDAFKGLPNLVWLDLSINLLKEIATNEFRGLVSLIDLYLNENKIEVIQPHVFEELSNLTFLDLSSNLLQELKPGTFTGLVNLKYLNLQECMLKNLHPGVFLQLIQLTQMDLHSNILKTLEPGIFTNLFHLTYLDLSSNMLEEIKPDAFTDLVSLLCINLSTNMLDDLQTDTFEELSNLQYLDLSVNMLQEVQSNVFAQQIRLQYIELSSNMLKELNSDTFRNLTSLLSVNLQKNMLQEILPDTFSKLASLTYLDLSSNMLKELLPGTFDGLIRLNELLLNNNMLTKLLPNVLQDLTSLTILDVSNNLLNELQPGVFRGLGYLTHLYLENNRIVNILPLAFQDLTSLTVLYLSNNPIAYLVPGLFQQLINLDYLLLQNNSLKFLPDGIFSSLDQLRNLDLSGNNLNDLPFHPFKNCALLESLNITQNPLQWIQKDAFRDLNETVQVFVDNYASCCFVTKSKCIYNSTMSPFLTCKRLLPYTILRVGIWIVSIFAIVNNAISLLIRCRYRHQTNKVQFLLISNLSVSDFLMGVYLIILLSADLYYTEYFPSHSESWRKSVLCKMAGSLSVLSSEASVFFITMISIDRAIAIKFPFRTRRFGTKSISAIVLFLWLTAFCISIISFVLSGMDSDAYDIPEICVGLPISRQPLFIRNDTYIKRSSSFEGQTPVQYVEASGSQTSMYFSIAIFTVLNLCCFSVVGFCYTVIFTSARQTTTISSRRFCRSTSLKDIKMAKKMFPLVLTDFCCWVPIGVLSILVQAGAVEVNPVAYAWIATFILPINSSINPFLYTLSDVIAGRALGSLKKHKWKKQNYGETTGFEMRTIVKSKIETVNIID